VAQILDSPTRAFRLSYAVNYSDKKVLVTGAYGFLGRAVVSALEARNCREIVKIRKANVDLTRQEEVEKMLELHRPDLVFHLAGLVGGILVNKERPADFFLQNLLMGTFMLHYSWKSGVDKFVAAGAGCGYPQFAPIPLKETDFWAGLPQKESAPYSLAKRLLTVQSESYERQHGFHSIICIPGNLYGPWDNFNLHDAHVVPALVRKFVEAEMQGLPEVEVWGTGKPTRDYVYSHDVAEGMLLAAEKYDKSELVNISSGVEFSVSEVCEILQDVTGFKGKVTWNTSKPEGQARRCFDLSKARADLGYSPRTDLRTGIEKTVRWFKDNYHNPELRK